MQDSSLIPNYIGVTIRLITLIAMVFYILPKQRREVFSPPTELRWLNRNRLLIFIALICYALSSLVPAGYQACKIVSCDSLAFLQQAATIMSNVANFLVVAVLVLLYREKV